MTVLTESLVEHGEDISPRQGGAAIRAVAERHVKELYHKRHAGEAEPGEDPKKLRERSRKNFGNHVEFALGAELLRRRRPRRTLSLDQVTLPGKRKRWKTPNRGCFRLFPLFPVRQGRKIAESFRFFEHFRFFHSYSSRTCRSNIAYARIFRTRLIGPPWYKACILSNIAPRSTLKGCGWHRARRPVARRLPTTNLPCADCTVAARRRGDIAMCGRRRH